MRIVTFASGSSGNCVFIESGSTGILIDAGISMRRISTALALCGRRMEDLSAVLVSHEHSDHVQGLAAIIKKHPVPVYAPRTVANHLRYTIAGVENYLNEIPVGESFALGGVSVTAFHTPHDTEESVGYRIDGDKSFALATDMGHVTEEVESALSGADAVLIEANHDPDMLRDGPYPYFLKKRILSPRGHLSNADCAALAARLADSGTKHIVLGHLSRENNTPSLALAAVKAALSGRDTAVFVAPAAESFSLEIGESSHAEC